MIRQLARSRITAGVFALSALAGSAVPASAQVVANTFGPGDSYNTSTAWSVGTVQSVAQGFVYGGPAGGLLSQMRLALLTEGQGYTIGLRHGSAVGTATTLESWSLSSFGGGILTLVSALNPTFVSGDTYWITAMSLGSGGWMFNDQGIYGGMQYAQPGGNESGWTGCAGCESAAYDVTVNSTVTPEPASLALLGTGLVGLGIPVLRRRRKGAAIA